MEIMCPGEDVYEDPRLAESQRGIWHVMTSAEVEARLPFEVIRKTREDLYHYRPLGGENWPDVELRIHSFLGTLHRDYGGKDVLMVVHGHWLVLFQRLVHRFSIDEAMERYRSKICPNASVTIYNSSEDECGNSRLVLSGSMDSPIVPWKDLLSS